MFESGKPISHAEAAGIAAGGAHLDDVLIGRRERVSASVSGGALRLLDWNELTARLNASRDLRQLLKRDETLGISEASGSFADAAARYFRTCEEQGGEQSEGREPDVNPVALEPSKCSPGIAFEHDKPHPLEVEPNGNAETGDARED